MKYEFDEIRELVVDFMEHNKILTELENENWYYMEDCLYALLTDINSNKTFKIFDNLQKQYHMEDIKNELDDYTKLTDEQLKMILDKYEEYLGDDESWNYALQNAISNVLEGDE